MSAEKRPVIGWVRVRKSKDGRAFFPVSFKLEDGTTFRGILNLDKGKVAAALTDSELQGKEVVGTISLDLFNPSAAKGAAASAARTRPTKPAADDDMPF